MLLENFLSFPISQFSNDLLKKLIISNPRTNDMIWVNVLCGFAVISKLDRNNVDKNETAYDYLNSYNQTFCRASRIWRIRLLRRGSEVVLSEENYGSADRPLLSRRIVLGIAILNIYNFKNRRNNFDSFGSACWGVFKVCDKSDHRLFFVFYDSIFCLPKLPNNWCLLWECNYQLDKSVIRA